MKEFFLMRQWGWKSSGSALGLIIVLAVVLIKPIGVSTQYVVFDALILDTVYPQFVQRDDTAPHGYVSKNKYLGKDEGKYAKAVAHPLSYGLIFAFSMIAGGFLAARVRSKPYDKNESVTNLARQQRFGRSYAMRYCAAFVGGVLVLYGARLAGGCTSGHMMSGMMQTSYSGYVFTIAAFLIAIPAARLMYRSSSSINQDKG